MYLRTGTPFSRPVQAHVSRKQRRRASGQTAPVSYSERISYSFSLRRRAAPSRRSVVRGWRVTRGAHGRAHVHGLLKRTYTCLGKLPRSVVSREQARKTVHFGRETSLHKFINRMENSPNYKAKFLLQTHFPTRPISSYFFRIIQRCRKELKYSELLKNLPE